LTDEDRYPGKGVGRAPQGCGNPRIEELLFEEVHIVYATWKIKVKEKWLPRGKIPDYVIEHDRPS
jgi:hypothetical protein